MPELKAHVEKVRWKENRRNTRSPLVSYDENGVVIVPSLIGYVPPDPRGEKRERYSNPGDEEVCLLVPAPDSNLYFAYPLHQVGEVRVENARVFDGHLVVPLAGFMACARMEDDGIHIILASI